MNNFTNTEYSESSFCSSSIYFSNNQQRDNESMSNNSIQSIEQTEQNAQMSTQENNNNNLTLKGDSLIDLNYFQYFKQTYKSKTHPINHFFNVTSTKKDKHFVELCIQNSNKRNSISNDDIYTSLQSVCPTKVEKARQLYNFLLKQESFNMNDANISSDSIIMQNDPIIMQNEAFIMQNEAFKKATCYLNQRANRLFKFNIFCKNEQNETCFLKHGVSNLTLNALRMSADFYQYVHMRFGMSPFMDRFYAKNFFEVNQSLLEQSSFVSNEQFQTKYVMNLSSVGAIYTQTECEIVDLKNGFCLEIQYYRNESILTRQIPEINQILRLQAREYVYSQSSSKFINKYYPNAKIWQQNKTQEVDQDIIDKLIKKRHLTLRTCHQSQSPIQSQTTIKSQANNSNYTLASSMSFVF